LARAQVAQSVEQRIENPRVGSSILSLGTILPFAVFRMNSVSSDFPTKTSQFIVLPFGPFA
jgi:hypothetical protein